MRCWFGRAGAVLLVLMLVGGLAGTVQSVAADTAGGGVVASGGFSDVGGGVHQPGIDALETDGVFEGTGCGEGLFCPGDPIRRWMMAVWMVRVLDGGDPEGSGSSRFADVDAGVWWAPYVERLAELGVTAGCATGPLRFCPDEPVTRGQMATFLVRAFGLGEAPAAGFADTGGNTHASSIDALAAEGVTAGCATGPLRFCPGASVTRGQMATFVARAVGLVELPAPPPADDPSPVPNGYLVIDGGEAVTCGLQADGAIECWGLNRSGQADPPVGGSHSCGIRTGGTVECWGNNRYGQADPPVGGFTDVAVGGSHSCGIRTGGTVECWGNNRYGQADPPDGRFVDVATDAEYSCGVRTGGTVECWGRDRLTESRRDVFEVPDGRLISASATGGSWLGGHACGVQTDGAVVCWGSNGYGQADPPGGRFVDVATSSDVSCGIRAGGMVECWGSGHADDPPEGQFTSVSLSTGYGCGIRAGGSVECWGYDIWGRTRAPVWEFSTVSAGGYYPCGLRTDGTVSPNSSRVGGLGG